MAYQNVGTPRFYVDILSYLKSHGLLTHHSSTFNELVGGVEQEINALDLVGINPTTQMDAWSVGASPGLNDQIAYSISDPLGRYKNIMPEKQNFIMVLGHNLKTANGRFFAQAYEGNWYGVASENYVNLTNAAPSNDGFSIMIGNDADDLDGQTLQYRLDNRDSTESSVINYESLNNRVKIGSLLYGTYYDMPHSPDLNLTMTREMDGVKRIRTKGGADLVDHKYIKSPNWGSLSAWELKESGDDYYKLGRSGRRIWDLSFSYLDDGDIFGSNQSLGIPMDVNYTAYYPIYTGGGETGGADPFEGYEASDMYFNTSPTYSDGFLYNILTDDNFYSQVIHKTNGGQLRFVFQPDSNNSNPDSFAICKLDMKSFKFEQVANGVYNMKLKIREVW